MIEFAAAREMNREIAIARRYRFDAIYYELIEPSPISATAGDRVVMNNIGNNYGAGRCYYDSYGAPLHGMENMSPEDMAAVVGVAIKAEIEELDSALDVPEPANSIDDRFARGV